MMMMALVSALFFVCVCVFGSGFGFRVVFALAERRRARIGAKLMYLGAHINNVSVG